MVVSHPVDICNSGQGSNSVSRTEPDKNLNEYLQPCQVLARIRAQYSVLNQNDAYFKLEKFTMNNLKTTVVVLLSVTGALILSNIGYAMELSSDESRVSLVSTKVLADGTSSAAEVFTFNSLTGSVAEEGAATVTIDLQSIDTGIDIRNERMAEFFFQTSEYPEAHITSQVPVSALVPGSHMLDLDVEVDLHGQQMSYTVPVMVSSVDAKVIVIAREPVLVNAASFELQGGLGKLGELAGLMHIPATVPVSFNLTFTR